MEQPRLQQQHRKPNSSQRTLTGSAFLRVTLTRVTVAWGRDIVNTVGVSEIIKLYLELFRSNSRMQ